MKVKIYENRHVGKFKCRNEGKQESRKVKQ